MSKVMAAADGGVAGVPDDPQLATILSWLKDNVGGTVVQVTPQPRWRPQWFIDVERDGEVLPLMVRGDRRDTDTTWTLNHEMRFQEVLDRQGAAVPHVYGWIDELPAFVTERVAGRPNFEGTSDEVRDRVVDEYLEALAAIHQLDIGPLVEAGIDHPDDPEDSAMLGMARMEDMYRRQKVSPDPLMEFSLGWFHRHPPRSKGRQGPVVWDSGQFHHHDGHFVAALDLELGHIGDPMMDLAGWRMRDSVIGFGDFNRIYDRYSEIVGEPVDIEAIQLHHIAFTYSNQLAFSHALKAPPPGSDFATNLQWCNETNLYVTEGIAEYMGVELPTVELPEDKPSKTAPVHQHLIRSLLDMRTDDDYLRHQIRISFRVARHLARVDEIGPAVLEADVDDLHQLFGHRPEDWLAGEAELERLIQADAREGRHDEQLLGVLHRRALRAQMLNGPAGSAMARHIPIQSFSD